MNLDGEQLLREIERRGALQRGHFLLSSGLHSDQYVQCALLFRDGAFAESLGRALASLAPEPPDCVVSPALGGLLIGHEVAKALRAPFIFAEREGGAMALRRGFSLEEGRTALIVEDVLTTGKSTLEVASLLRSLGARVAAVLSVIDRGVEQSSLGFPARSLLRLPLRAQPPGECGLCRLGAPLVKPGSRPEPKPC